MSLCNIWNHYFTRWFMIEGIQFQNNQHLCGVTKERCELNRAHQEMINRPGNPAGGSSNQKLSLQDSCVSQWVGFLQPHGDVYVWVGHPKLLAQAVEPVVCGSSCSRADTHSDLTNRRSKAAILLTELWKEPGLSSSAADCPIAQVWRELGDES